MNKNISYCQQPEVIACQGEGEMYKTFWYLPTRDVGCGISTRNLSADNFFISWRASALLYSHQGGLE